MASNGKDVEVVPCAGCGKPIRSYSSPRKRGERAVDIRIGTILEKQSVNGKRKPGRPRKAEDDFRPESTWGRMHFNCFLRAVESPGQLLAELGL